MSAVKTKTQYNKANLLQLWIASLTRLSPLPPSPAQTPVSFAISESTPATREALDLCELRAEEARRAGKEGRNSKHHVKIFRSQNTSHYCDYQPVVTTVTCHPLEWCTGPARGAEGVVRSVRGGSVQVESS